MSVKTCAAAFAALSLVAAIPAAAATRNDDAQAAAAERAQAKPDAKAGEPKICKRLENTASRMRSERLCLTKAEWREFDAQQD